MNEIALLIYLAEWNGFRSTHWQLDVLAKSGMLKKVNNNSYFWHIQPLTMTIQELSTLDKHSRNNQLAIETLMEELRANIFEKCEFEYQEKKHCGQLKRFVLHFWDARNNRIIFFE